MAGAAEQVKETHALIATITVLLSVLTSILRTYMLFEKNENTTLKIVSFIFYALAALSVSATGFFGGTLVYNFMMPL